MIKNKLEITNINVKANDIAHDCTLSDIVDNPTVCLRDVNIVYITAGNTDTSNTRRKIGVILSGQTKPKDNYIVELGFKSFRDHNKPKDPIRILQYHSTMSKLKNALLTGNKVDICVNITDSSAILITDASIKIERD